MLLPIQTALDRPLKDTSKFLGKLATKVFVLFFGSKRTSERNSLYPLPNAMDALLSVKPRSEPD